MDTARKKKLRLYIAFLDYVKAYDSMNRNKLLSMLAAKGCSNVFLQAIGKTISNTISCLGEEEVRATAGVRQGGSTSCSLFTFYVNETITSVNGYGQDRFLENCHVLLFMDDTVVLATSRAAMQDKLDRIYTTASQLELKLHPNKSKYLCINGGSEDRPFKVGDVTIDSTDTYIYLGATITNDNITKQVHTQVTSKLCHARKFSSFLSRNHDAPFSVKQTVWESALFSSVLFDCETWLCKDLSTATKLYNATVKELLGVRIQTPNDLALIELGIPSLPAIVRHKQQFFLRQLKSYSHFAGSPVEFAINSALKARSPMGLLLDQILSDPTDPITMDIDRRKATVLTAQSSRFSSYREFNPDLLVHPMYSKHKDQNGVPEAHRIATTRMRLGSHWLRIETGRWSRLPREQRLCPCGEIQSESHVLLNCPLAEHLRNQNQDLNFIQLNQLMNCQMKTLCKFCYLVLNFFSNCNI